MRATKFAVLALLISLVMGMLAGSASAADYKTTITLVIPSNASWLIDEAYILTVPADLTIEASGWNSLGAIHVEHATDSRDHFDPDKKLVVTVTASNDFKLTSGTNTIGYTFGKTKGASDKSFEFTAASIDAGTSIDVGITVETYIGKPAGTYEDYITFKAEVQDVSAESTAPQYYDKLTEASYDGDNWNCVEEDTAYFSLNGQTIASEQAIELAKYQAEVTGKSCVVIYSVSSDGQIYFAESNGNTSAVGAWSSSDLLNYTVYYVAN